MVFVLVAAFVSSLCGVVVVVAVLGVTRALRIAVELGCPGGGAADCCTRIGA